MLMLVSNTEAPVYCSTSTTPVVSVGVVGVVLILSPASPVGVLGAGLGVPLSGISVLVPVLVPVLVSSSVACSVASTCIYYLVLVSYLVQV